MKKICFFICAFMLFMSVPARGEGGLIPEGDVKSCILVEQSTGEVLYEENADEQLPIASVTKIMTMLLIMEEIDGGRMGYDDLVTVSENAMSYGGSTMFLETGEQLTVSDMLKGIAVASANDGAVAMAEHISGSETAFVDRMNEKAAELGMVNTHFVNANGLDDEGHYSSARDVALMSRALLEHPDITKYTSIWTDELRDGKFKLANTNKLIRFYTGANGLKTGSTSQALCCLSASAERDGMQLIAVVLGSPTSAKRFSSAKTLLDHGFANYRITQLAAEGETVCEADVANSTAGTVAGAAAETKTLLENKSEQGEIEKRVYINDGLTAPVKAGDRIGTMEFVRNETVIGSTDIVALADAEKKSIIMIMRDIVSGYLKAET